MYAKIKILVGILVVIVIVAGGWWVWNIITVISEEDCDALKQKIIKNINEANYCSIDEDCIIVDFGCPFGCGSYVNRNADVDGMKAEIDLYNSCVGGICEYMCMSPREPKCVNNKCISLPPQFSPGEEVTIQGTVLENNLGCRVDARCYLRVLSNEQEIFVVYHYGEWPSCLNEDAANQGEKLREGDEVEIYGQYSKLGDMRSISTCNSKDYYIKKIV